jgi:multimeric flavodoxin WrbA
MLLVVYYSLSGKTATLAKYMAESLKADTLVIEDLKSRRGVWGFIRSGYESVSGKKPKIRTIPADMGDEKMAASDGVILLSPIWAGRISSPMRSFISQHQPGFSQYAIFFTCGDTSNQYEKAIDEAKALCPKASCLIGRTLCSEAPDLMAKADMAVSDIRRLFPISTGGGQP